ncbi:hypothetical protein [Streptomyces hirsutus]|uniref:hypothetical protein n=1 Tax=Streptomyces hirsutus TaxID=35620 RepID=UPI000B322025|nr:hypothetical protein [Streptomyces hirsutus]
MVAHDLRVETLIVRGRAEGAFRTDLPIAWPVDVPHSVMHSAADEIRAGRLTADRITATVLAAFTSPGKPVPGPGTGT